MIEGQHVELKGAFTWNSRTGKEDGNLRLGSARSIAAFANSLGGKLVIGVGDDGAVHGIDQELAALFDDNHVDRFESFVREHLKNMLVPPLLNSYRISFELHAVLWVCCIDVDRTPGVTYVKTRAGSGSFEHAVYMRTGNCTIKVADIDRDRLMVERFGGKWSL